MSRFARHNRVLFVEPAQFWGVIQEEGAKVRTEAGRLLYRAQDNLYVQRLINLLPFAESAAELGINIVRWANEIVCRMEVKRAVHQLGFREPILWAYNRPDTRRILAAVEPHLVCYDVFDKYSEMPHLSARGRVEAQKLHE